MTKNKVRKFIFYMYVFVVLWITVFNRNAPTGKNMLMHPFWEYINFFENISWAAAHDIVCNVLLFIPFGFLYRVAYDKYKKYTIIVALLMSWLIEMIQLIFQLGCAEIDDIFNNTIGGYIGYKIYEILRGCLKYENSIFSSGYNRGRD